MPGDDDDAVDVALLAEIDHPDGIVDKVIVEDGAAVERGVGVAVHGQRRPPVLPILPQMALVVQPRVVVIRQVFDFWKIKKVHSFTQNSGRRCQCIR